MKIPTKFISQGIWWTVRYTDDMENLGETDYENQVVKIQRSLSQEMKEMSFLHEITHTFNTTIDHTLVDSLSNQFYQVLKENKLI